MNYVEKVFRDINRFPGFAVTLSIENQNDLIEYVDTLNRTIADLKKDLKAAENEIDRLIEFEIAYMKEVEIPKHYKKREVKP